MSLSGLRVIIAGGATGIGAATARMLGTRGASVVVGDINAAGAKLVVDEIVTSGATAVEFDLSDEESIKSLIDTGAKTLGGLDGLVNMAADVRPQILGNDHSVAEMDAEIWRRTLSVNLVGYGLTTKYALPHLLETGHGSIVNISSIAAFAGEPLRPAYASAKAGVHALTRHTARTWGPQNVRANAIAVGPIETPQLVKSIAEDVNLQNAMKQVPLQRMGKPDEMASLILFLLSQEASYVTGQIWAANGGSHLRD